MLKKLVTSIGIVSLFVMSMSSIGYAQTDPSISQEVQNEGTTNNQQTESSNNLWWIIPLLAIPPLILLMRGEPEDRSNETDIDVNRRVDV